jgi:DNA-binding transcriptional regulator PaaX
MHVKKWLVLVYRIPTEPASKRVAIWRDLKRTGALYLQQCVCILPDLGNNAEELERVMAKVTTVGGETVRFLVPRLDSGDEARIIAGFRAQRTSEDAEIIEECETKFQKEVEFEHFRQNYTFE